MIERAARALLGPVVGAQAAWLRRRVVELPEAAGRRTGAQGSGPVAVRLLIVGDSSAAGVGVATQDEALAGQLARALATRLRRRVQWQLVARTGARSEDVAHLVGQARLRRADIGVVVVGVNDIARDVRLRDALEWRGRIAAALQARAGVRHVVFPALPEMEKFPALPQPLAWYAGRHARRNNRAQADWAAGRTGVSHAAMDGLMDPALMAGDGFHPGPKLYRAVARQLAAHIAAVAPTVNASKEESR